MSSDPEMTEAAIREMLLEGQGNDEGEQILPDLTGDMSTLEMIEACLHLLEKRRDALLGGRLVGSWQPIKTAPMDGTHVMLFCPQGDGSPGSTFRVTCGFWDEDEGGIVEHRDLQGRYLGQDESEGWAWWCTLDGGFSEETMMPTHWMPLPTPPAALEGQP